MEVHSQASIHSAWWSGNRIAGHGVSRSVMVPGGTRGDTLCPCSQCAGGFPCHCQGEIQGRESYSGSSSKGYSPLRQGKPGGSTQPRGSGSVRLLVHTSDQEAERGERWCSAYCRLFTFSLQAQTVQSKRVGDKQSLEMVTAPVCGMISVLKGA